MIIGNSSVGIRECAFLGVPAVNIGSRQYRRERGKNVIDVSYNKSDIKNAIHHLLKIKRSEESTVYGGGDAGEKIANILSEIDLISHKPLHIKTFLKYKNKNAKNNCNYTCKGWF